MEPKLYGRFLKIDSFIGDTIENHRLFMNSPCNFNDPFETSENLFNDNFHYKEIEESFRILSLTGALSIYDQLPISDVKYTESKLKPFFNHLLWSHYADHHRGICLVFDIIQNPPMKIDYVEERPDASDKSSDKKIGEIVHDLLINKGEAWEYENEYRYFRTMSKFFHDEGDSSDFYECDSKAYYNFKDNLKAVIFGCCTPANDKAKVIGHLNKYFYKNMKDSGNSISVVNLQKSTSKYELEVKSIRDLISRDQLPSPDNYKDFIRKLRNPELHAE
jgi:hypothetical protein